MAPSAPNPDNSGFPSAWISSPARDAPLELHIPVQAAPGAQGLPSPLTGTYINFSKLALQSPNNLPWNRSLQTLDRVVFIKDLTHITAKRFSSNDNLS